MRELTNRSRKTLGTYLIFLSEPSASTDDHDTHSSTGCTSPTFDRWCMPVLQASASGFSSTCMRRLSPIASITLCARSMVMP